MRLLLDENYPLDAIAALTAAGYDVCLIAEVAPSISDRKVLALARRESRMLVTFDADFGELIFLHGEPPPLAVVLLRLHPIMLADVVAATRRALDTSPEGAFVVTTRDSLRRRPFAQTSTSG